MSAFLPTIVPALKVFTFIEKEKIQFPLSVAFIEKKRKMVDP